ncbi:HNH endonuclease [Avibacterium gallinarum]|uniref:HNH endonuclease n=1 Tax=Avibacterium gallinarum TaxID=755 RepID=UPI003BF85319
MSNLTKKKIIDAFVRFDKGDRPENFRKPKSWYVFTENKQSLYPVKAIWALANDLPLRSFNTHNAVRELKKYGFDILNLSINENKPFEEEVFNAFNSPQAIRRKYLEVSNKKPEKEYYSVAKYKRNPYVVAEVLHRANGVCESCNRKAPFNRKSNDLPYLEVHHIVPLSENGDDTMENCIALCPNCHRKAHFG